jgi:hypothetical protein
VRRERTLRQTAGLYQITSSQADWLMANKAPEGLKAGGVRESRECSQGAIGFHASELSDAFQFVNSHRNLSMRDGSIA